MHAVNIRDVYNAAILSHISGDRFIVNGNEKGGINKFLAGFQSFLERIVLCVIEFEFINLLQVDGTSIGVEKFSDTRQNSFQ